MATVDTGQLERVLGPDWQHLTYEQAWVRADRLERAAGFVRRLISYMESSGADTAGEALAKLHQARNGTYPDAPAETGATG